jgi:NAD(P)-dependent dehydrogenase (short-subunit alcohol dehydrogenase family)
LKHDLFAANLFRKRSRPVTSPDETEIIVTLSKKKTVLITGASSGIGQASVEHMIKVGWKVFATVRKAHDGERLQTLYGSALTPVLMDVQDRESIQSAAKTVADELRDSGLDGLVNNAGIGMARPLEYITPDDLEEVFDINVFGQLAVTQSFLPLIRAARGRVINITSIGAHIAIPFGGPLNASKSAFGLLSDTLRLELEPFGIYVVAVEPGAISTPAVEKTLGNMDEVIGDLPPRGAGQYATMLKSFAQRAYARESKGSSPDVVAQAVQHALTARRPRIRYRVGNHAKLLATMASVVPDRLLDLIRLRLLGLPTKFGAVAG